MNRDKGFLGKTTPPYWLQELKYDEQCAQCFQNPSVWLMSMVFIFISLSRHRLLPVFVLPQKKKAFPSVCVLNPTAFQTAVLRAGLPSASSAQHLETNTHRASLPSSKGKIWLSLIQLQSTHTVGVAQSGLSLACKLLTAQGTFVWGDWHRWNRSRGSSRDLKLCLPLRCL